MNKLNGIDLYMMLMEKEINYTEQIYTHFRTSIRDYNKEHTEVITDLKDSLKLYPELYQPLIFLVNRLGRLPDKYFNVVL